MGNAREALAGICRDLTDYEARVRRLVEGHSGSLLNQSPAAGGWSCLQCIEPLVIANRMLVSSIELALPGLLVREAASGDLPPGAVWRFLLSM